MEEVAEAEGRTEKDLKKLIDMSKNLWAVIQSELDGLGEAERIYTWLALEVQAMDKFGRTEERDGLVDLMRLVENNIREKDNEPI
jgi:hypothetical protein